MMVTEQINFKKKCTGCAACYNICPYNAIEMEQDFEGFFFPTIDSHICTQCGRCLTVCEVSDENPEKTNRGKVYACQIKYNSKVLQNSTSGGFFSLLAKKILEEGGIVFGAIYNQELKVKHGYIEHESELYMLNGAKYVQSEIGDCYKKVNKFLKQKKKVLFSGTPCQIVGLYKYLSYKPKNLFTVEVICFGIPSPLLFEKCIEYYEERNKSKVLEYSFRDKRKYGWSHTTRIKMENGREIFHLNPQLDLYYRLWGSQGECLRESCYTCPYIGENRKADFTIGNYWGIEELCDSFENEKGVSLVITNNIEAELMMKQIVQKMKYAEGDWESILKYQHGLKIPKIRSKRRDTFYKDLLKIGISECADKYSPLSLKKKLFLKLPIKIQNIIYHPLKKKRTRSGVRF